MKVELETFDTTLPWPAFHRGIERWESRDQFLSGAWALFLKCGHVATLIPRSEADAQVVRECGHVLCVQCRDGKERA